MTRLLALMFLSVFFLQCNDMNKTAPPTADETAAESARLNAWFDKKWEEMLDRNPIYQTYLGIKKNYDSWGDLSDEFEEKEHQIMLADLKELKDSFDVGKLDKQSRVSYRMWVDYAETEDRNFRFRFHDYPVNQMYGTHSWIPEFLMNMHQVDSKADAEAYLKRLSTVDYVMDELIKDLEVRKQKGIIAPALCFDKAKDDCENILTGHPFDKSGEDSPLMEDFREKVEALDSLSGPEKQALVSEAEKHLLQVVKPAYLKFLEYWEGLEKMAKGNNGVWHLPEGEAFYAAELEEITTTNMTPEQIYETGQQEIKRIHEEMRAVMQQVKFEGDLKAFFDFMRDDARFYLPTTTEGKQQYLDSTHAIVDAMRGKIDALFITQPKAELVVKAVEPYREATAGEAFYESPAPDGSRPGIYYVNLFDMKQQPLYQMEALIYHEAIPGHHMQLSISQELEGLPKFRTLGGDYTAYIEGWGLYSEYIPKEIGCYTDPYSDFGRLAMELWRAVRLVVDVGLHQKKWTREEAIAFYAENTPNPYDDCVKMVERHLVMPGQATAYKIGQLKILSLREEAQQALGEAFDIREFHEVVLTNGALPLHVLEQLVKEWVEQKKATRV